MSKLRLYIKYRHKKGLLHKRDFNFNDNFGEWHNTVYLDMVHFLFIQEIMT
jgi:hypothetical protein